jgi:hypothetical protein
MVKNEGDVQIGGFPPYPVSYRSLIPKEQQCTNLLVPVCLSASHIAYGSIRMEPVFMVMGQSAAVAATLAIDEHTSVQQINIRRLQDILHTNPLADNSQPDILVDNDQSANVTVLGNWKTNENSHNSYAASSLQINDREKKPASVRFRIAVPETGRYKIYRYTPEADSAASSVAFNIANGKKIIPVSVNLRALNVEGQTSGEWIYVGEFNFIKNAKSYVEITNKNADGIIVADAILLVRQY